MADRHAKRHVQSSILKRERGAAVQQIIPFAPSRVAAGAQGKENGKPQRSFKQVLEYHEIRTVADIAPQGASAAAKPNLGQLTAP
jgi:hypothetical protein